MNSEVTDSLIRQLRRSTINMLKELGSIDDAAFGKDVADLIMRIKSAEDIDSIIMLHDAVSAIVADFVRHHQVTRDETTLFLRRLSEKLSVLGGEMSRSADTVQSGAESDVNFTRDLKVEINSISSSVETIDVLDDLKAFVSDGLGDVTTKVDGKQRELDERRNQIKQFSEHFLTGFDTVLCKVRDQIKTLEEQSRLDPLTGVNNRRVFQEHLECELNRFHRYGHVFSLVFIDIDRFKNVNDTYGHRAGDLVLRAIARRAVSLLRKSDHFARYGGEEFVAVLPETDIHQSVEVAEKLRKSVAKTRFEHDNKVVPVTVSIGVTEVRDADKTPSSVLTRADTYLYFAKENGRDRVISDMTFTGA